MKLHKKKKLILPLIILLLFSSSLFISIYSILMKESNINNKKAYRFAGDYNHPPYEYVDNDKSFKGFNIDIINAIAEVSKLDIEIIPMEWKDAIEALDNKEIDGIIGMSKSEERMGKYKFVSPTVINNQVIFVRKDTVYINELKDLSGLKVSCQKNDYNESLIKAIPDIQVFPKPEQEDVIMALVNSEVDAALGNQLVGMYHLQKNNITDKVKVVGEPLVSTEYGPVVRKDNIELYRLMEDGFEIIKKNKKYDKIYKKWFGADFNYVKLIFDIYRNEIVITAIGLLIIFAFLYFYSKMLQKQVFKRTGELELANNDLVKQQNEIYNLAYFDSITSLPNRLYFTEELNNIFENMEEREDLFAILLLDLDKFKHINDTLGHNAGDYIIKLLGVRLSKLIDENDLVARIGGDEYYILLNSIRDSDDAIDTANKILEDFKKPYKIKDYELYLTTSIGIAVYPDGGLDSQSMIKNADLALYKAKDNGGNSYYLYGNEIASQGLERMMLLSQLRQAIDNDELVLYYQPQIDIYSEEIIGVEALVRWEHPEKGLLYPDKFIPLAEESGLIIQIGEWVIKKATKQAKEWVDKGYDIVVSVNISAKQFQHAQFIEEVIKALKESKLEPQNLTLEITETIVISDMKHTLEILRMLRSFGVAVSIDDFGTGYSSLSYLNEMSVNELKIDRSFIWDIEKNNKNKMISNTIILLGKQLGLRVIAEGVENIEQLDILKNLNCDIAQGYHFSKPVPKEKIEEIIANKKSPA